MNWLGFPPRVVLFLIILATLPWAVGCKKEDLTSLVDQAKEKARAGAEQLKQQVAGATQQAQEQLNLAGSIELTLDSPVTTSACYATLIPATEGRPALLQLRSYPSPDKETAPSIFLQAQVAVAAWPELSGQTFPAELWVQTDTSGNLWSSAADPIELKISTIDDKTLTADLTSGTLRNAGSGAELRAVGKFVAVLSSTAAQ